MTTAPTETQSAPSSGAPEQVKDEALSKASDLKDAATEHAGAVVDQAKAQARNVLGDTRDELQKRAEEQSKRAGAALQNASKQLHGMAEHAPAGPVTDLTRQLAGSLDRVSSRIETGGVQGVADDVRSFAQRRPAAFLVGAGVAGFVLTRLFRAASAAGSSDTSGAPYASDGRSTPPMSGSLTSVPSASVPGTAVPVPPAVAPADAGVTGLVTEDPLLP
jgi:hypothetical protein